MKDLVIGAISDLYWNDVKYWCNSLNACGFSGNKVCLVQNTDELTINKLKKRGIEVQKVEQSNGAFYDDRFYFFWKYLNISKRKYNRVITTDVRDIIFQTNPSIWLNKNLNDERLIINSEAIKYKDEEWNKNNFTCCFGEELYENVKENTVYNSGVLCGDHKFIENLCLLIYRLTINQPYKVRDQSTLNFLINFNFSNKIKFVNLSNGWQCPSGTLHDPQNIESLKSNLLENIPKVYNLRVLTENGKPFVFWHQWDRTEWADELRKKYD